MAPYERSDDFSSKILKPIWQWNHAPDNAKWSLTERPGFLRLHALLAPDFWQARNTLTQRAIGPVSIPTVELELGGMKLGGVAGLGLLNSPYAWIGVRYEASGFLIEQLDKTTGKTAQTPLQGTRVWFRAECDFFTEKATFHFSTNGKSYQTLGDTFKMVFQLKTFQGVRYSLFHYNVLGGLGGHVDFARFTVEEPQSRGLTKPIPYGKTITLKEVSSGSALTSGAATQFKVLDRGQGRVALRPSTGSGGEMETFQWIETPQGELTLLSLKTHRYLRLTATGTSGQALADSTGPPRSRNDGSRFAWSLVR